MTIKAVRTLWFGCFLFLKMNEKPPATLVASHYLKIKKGTCPVSQLGLRSACINLIVPKQHVFAVDIIVSTQPRLRVMPIQVVTRGLTSLEVERELRSRLLTGLDFLPNIMYFIARSAGNEFPANPKVLNRKRCCMKAFWMFCLAVAAVMAGNLRLARADIKLAANPLPATAKKTPEKRRLVYTMVAARVWPDGAASDHFVVWGFITDLRNDRMVQVTDMCVPNGEKGRRAGMTPERVITGMLAKSLVGGLKESLMSEPEFDLAVVSVNVVDFDDTFLKRLFPEESLKDLREGVARTSSDRLRQLSLKLLKLSIPQESMPPKPAPQPSSTLKPSAVLDKSVSKD